jgi:ATP-dependent exoDNAse (exonuclease V) alpha subunit
MNMRNEHNHTVFNKALFNMIIPCMQIDARKEMEKQVYDYLYEVALCHSHPRFAGAGDEVFLCTKYDHMDATLAANALQRIYRTASSGAKPVLRGLDVPQLFPPLTARQTEIAKHIQTHWITLVEGLPGTGKTSVITWIMSHYQNVMLCSFVGMMVKSLQKRNGRRKEAAHTIHHLLAMAKYNAEAAKLWFAKFQVLVVDEFSNVSMTLFRKLLCLLPNVSKIVLVGDHRQLKPIEGGDPMGDLLSVFGSQELFDNLRVVPELRALQMAPFLISQGRAREIQFTQNGGPIGFFQKETNALYNIFASFKGQVNILMNLHIVLLVHKGNDGRVQLNRECESMWQKLGVLKKPPQGGIRIRGGLELYPGCKITFLQNYNSPIVYKNDKGEDCKSSLIANGELAIVKHIRTAYGTTSGFILTVVDSEDPADEPETKTIWIEEHGGVHPMHIDHGYATTTYKSQGREFPYVIFWNLSSPQEHWTRPNAYVAVSRGKQRVWIAGNPEDFFTVCKQVDPKRKTIFSMILDMTNEPLPGEPEPLADFSKLRLLNKNIPCVPILEKNKE